ncbi:XPA protein C-terminus-domain-containing protein, partial [Blyttiomyces helicus]
EFDLSKIKDTRGGFLLDEVTEEPGSKRPRLEERKPVVDPPLDPTGKGNPTCETCKSIDVDPAFRLHFKVDVCRACKDTIADRYSLLTKTECKEDYLLTDSELKDYKRLPHWERPNPHKSTYSNMLLYMRGHQVEKFAFEKWGSPEALDAEFERREDEKKARKEKKFQSKLMELRKKTRTSTWQKKLPEDHVH